VIPIYHVQNINNKLFLQLKYFLKIVPAENK